jgi:hypothetical protein
VSRRVDDMFEQIKSKLPGAPKFLLCLLPEICRLDGDVVGGGSQSRTVLVAQITIIG